MKVDPKVLQQLANTYGVSSAANIKGFDQTIAQCGKSNAKYEPLLTGNGYEWSDEANGYVKGKEVIYFYTPKQVFLWVWDKTLMRMLSGSDMILKWVQGNDKYPEGKANSFMGTYLQMTGQAGGEEGGVAVAEPGSDEDEPDRSFGGGDISFSGTGGRGEKYADKPVDPTDAQILMLKKKAGKNNTLPSDLMIKVGLQAKKDGNQKMLDFLKKMRPLGENKMKSSDLTALIQEIVKGIAEAGDMWGQPAQIEQPYDEKWVEDWANKIWPDPMDIGRGRATQWRLTKSKRAKTGERVYMLSKTQQVTRTRFLVNRGTKWYYLDEKPDHTKKWVEVPAASVPVPDHNPEDEEELQEDGGGAVASGGGPVGMTTTTNVSPVTGPRAFKKKNTKEGYDRFDSRDWSELAVDNTLMSVCCGAPPLGNTDSKKPTPSGICSKCRNHATFEKRVDEMTTTSGGGGSSAGTTGYNIPGAFGRKMSNRKGHIEVLGYKMTPEGEKEYNKAGDKLY